MIQGVVDSQLASSSPGIMTDSSRDGVVVEGLICLACSSTSRLCINNTSLDFRQSVFRYSTEHHVTAGLTWHLAQLKAGARNMQRRCNLSPQKANGHLRRPLHS